MNQSRDIQDELPLTSILAHKVFPGRLLLSITEVADALGVTDQHIKNLIECGDLIATDVRSSTKGTKPSDLKDKDDRHQSVRQWLRIPVSEFDRFLQSRATTQL